MSRSSVSNIALSMSAGCLAILITACGTGGGQVGQITEAHEVAKSASPIARPASSTYGVRKPSTPGERFKGVDRSFFRLLPCA